MYHNISTMAQRGIAVSCVWVSLALCPVAQARPVSVHLAERCQDQMVQLENKVPQFDVREARGKLTAVATERLEITLDSSEGMIIFTLSPSTRVDLGTVQGTMADLRQGMQVRVFYVKRAKQNVAQSILVEARLFVPDIGTPEARLPLHGKGGVPR